MKINRFCIKIFGLVCSKWNYLVNFEVYAGGKGPAAEMRHGAVNNRPSRADGTLADPTEPGIISLFFRLVGDLERFPTLSTLTDGSTQSLL
jgi:hypothetical protein